MITDAQTNFVYFSELLKTNQKYAAFCGNLTAILDKHKIAYDFLPETNDIWCRDYMPIQVSGNKFIEYRYDPDYLQAKKWRSLKSYPDLICDRTAIKTQKNDVILDGGNVVKWEDKVILTDKIIEENKPKYNQNQLIEKLKELFEVNTIILIPWYKTDDDFYGHADGMIRFIGENRVLVDGYYKSLNNDFSRKFYTVLKTNNLNPVELQFTVKNESDYNWGYLNFLQMKDLLIVPKFDIDEDDQALDQIREVFPQYASKGQIETLDCRDIIKDGGVLNCISWTIMKY